MAQLKIDLIVDDKGSIVVSKFGGNVAKTLDSAGGSIDNFGRRLAYGGAAIGAFATAIGAVISVVGGKSLSVFSDLETRMIGVQKTTDFTAKEMETFGAAITEMARRVPVGTASLIDIAGVAGQLGIKGVGNVSKFTEVVGKLSLATDIVGSEGAASIARLLNVTGEGVDTVDKFGAVIVALGNNSAATESEILGLATEIGMATSVFSVSSSDALAMGAAMKSLGVQAELGGSVVGRAMRTIEASIAAGGEEIATLSKVTGIAEKDLKKAFGDNATKVFQQWLHGIGGLIEGGMTAAEALELFGLKGEEVLKVLPTMAVQSEVLDKSLKLANDELERGTALNIEAAKAGEAFEAQMQMGKNILSEMGYAIGAELAPEMKDMIAGLREWWAENDKIVTQDIAGHIGELAKTILGNKDSIIGLFTGMANAAASTVEVISHLAASVQGMAAVNSGKLSFFDFATMNAADMQQWLEKDRAGLVELENSLVSVREKITEAQNSWGNWKDKQQTLEPLRAEEARLVAEIENAGKAHEKSGAAATTAGAATTAAQQTVSDGVDNTVAKQSELVASLKATGAAGIDAYDKIDSRLQKYFGDLDAKTEKMRQQAAETNNKIWSANGLQDAKDTPVDSFVRLEQLKSEYAKDSAEQRQGLEEELNAYLENAGNDQLASQLARLEKKHQAYVGAAGQDMALQEKVAQWYQLKNDEIAKDAWKTSHDMLLAHGDFTDGVAAGLLDIQHDWTRMGDVSHDVMIDVRDTFRSEVGAALIEEFGGIEGAWGSLWDNALAKFGDYLADMILRFAAAVAEMTAIWAATEFMQWWTGNESFSFGSVGGGNGKGGSGSGGSVGGVTGAVASYGMQELFKEYIGAPIKDYLMSEYITPAYNYIVGGATTTGVGVGAGAGAGTAVAGYGSTVAGAGQGYGVIASQSAYQTGAFGTTYGTTAINAGGAGAGAGTSAGAGASTGAGAGITAGGIVTSIVGAMPAILLAVDMLNQKSFGDYMSGANVTPDQLAATGLSDTLTMLQGPNGFEGLNDALSDVFGPLGQFTQSSYDAANGILVQTSAMRGEGGLIESMNFAIQMYDESTGRWQTHTSLMGHMVQTMDDLAPQTDDAISATAAYVAEMYGVPTVADELIAAFLGINEGVYSLGQAVTGVAGGLMSSVNMINGAASTVGSGDRARSDDTDSPLWQQEWIGEINSQSDFTGMKAGGGNIPSGSWGIAGELGPEIIVGPADVISTRDTAAMMRRLQGAPQVVNMVGMQDGAMAALVAEIRRLRDDMAARLFAIANNTDKTQSVMRRWEGKGMPLRG